jgi:hypothetical protein
MNFKSISLTAAAVISLTAAGMPALAQPYDDGYRGDDRAYQDDRYDDRYDSDRSDGYQDYYRNGRYDRRQYDRYDGRGQAAQCRDNRAAGTLLGAIAGGVIGAQTDHHGSNDGSVALGAVLGGMVGNSVARSSAACDQYGSYYGYNQTYPYRVSRGYHGRYADYGRRGCRLAIAESRYGRSEYVTVCPDRYGRYRVRY